MVIDDFLLALDGVEGLALGVEVVEDAEDGHLGLVELLVLEDVGEELEGELFGELDLGYFVAALRHVGDQVQVLHETVPCGLVLLFAGLVKLFEGFLLEMVFVNCSLN